MRSFFKRRLIPVFLSFVIVVSFCVVPSSAVAIETVITGIMTGLGIGGTILDFCKDIGIYWDGDNPGDFGKWWCTSQLANGRISAGNCTEYSRETLDLIAHDWNTNYGHGVDSSIPEQMRNCHADVVMLDGTNRFVIAFRNHDVSVDDAFGLILTYYDGTVITSSEVSLDDELDGVPVWGPRSSLSSMPKEMVSKEALQNYARDYDGSMQKYGNYWIIFEPEHGAQVLCTSTGYPLAAYYEDDKAAINQDRPSTTIKDENGNEITIEGDDTDLDLDLTDKLLTIFGDVLNIDQLIYDEGTKTYFIDASKTDITNNITNNYYFKWEYHINYTSVTYIGQTEEYDKYYEVYYELPDGRDSADLTKEELEQLNVSVDVIPYERAADDTSLRSLYHFDGDTRDASYWNYCTDFAWKTGASLTYMDSGAFNGALYLDEKEHEFTITLPSAITAADFTLQFRYYQGYTAAPVNDTYISFGDTVVMRMNGTHLMKQTSTKMAEMPIGTWNEIAFMRKGKTHYWYLNGVCLASGTGFNGTTFEDTITFHFGADQQTFKYLDELRFLDYSLVDGGANYTPTSVPHDTNLSLVLPEGSTVVADEYWNIKSSKTNLLKMKPEDFMSGTLPSWYVKDTDDADENGFMFPRWMSGDFAYGPLYFDGVLGAHDGFLRLSTVLNYNNAPTITSNGMRAALMTRLGYDGEMPWQTGWPDSGLLTLSIVLADGTICSVPYDLDNDYERLDTFSWGKMGFIYEDDTWFIVVHPTYNTSIDIMYMELCAGTTDLSAEWVESVTVIPNENIKTPTLAVRTDLEITSHQIGGVRPSIPEKGMVWALVEGERITSLQIYNGQAWEGVDGRIWTGSRWIPASSYNIVTLQDMYDIVDATQDYEYIYTESGFWAWWQKSWNSFTAQLFNALGAGAGTVSPNTFWGKLSEALANGLSVLIETVLKLIAEILETLIGAALDLLTGFFDFISETVLSGVGDFFGAFSDSSLTEFFRQENEDGTTTVTLPEEVASGMAQITGFFNGLPGELRSVVLYGMALMFLLAAFKLVV